MEKKDFRARLIKAGVAAAAILPTLSFADDPTDLKTALPTSILDSGFWVAVGLVIGGVVAVKGVQIVMRLIKRV